MLTAWPLEELDIQKLEELRANRVLENQRLEFKSLILSSTESDKLELLKAITAFANTFGGDLVFGVHAPDGIPQSFNGVPITEIDQFKLKLESIVRTHIEPSLPNGCVQSKLIPVSDEKAILILRIAQSWLAPHRVGQRGNREFWTRTDSGKEPMTISQLRDAFALSSTVEERIHRFVSERTELLGRHGGSIYAPIPLPSEPKFLFHLIPISAFSRSETQVDVVSCLQKIDSLRPICARGVNISRLNLDGMLMANGGEREFNSSYTQVYRAGVIESLCCLPAPVEQTMRPVNPPVRELYVGDFESELRDGISRYLSVLARDGIQCPVVLFLSLLHAGNCRLRFTRHRHVQSPYTVDHNIATFPEGVMHDSSQAQLDRCLNSLLDALWNTAGYPNSPSFDDSGSWLGRD